MNLSNIPHDPLKIIAAYLIEDPQDFIHFRNTCKKFKKVVDQIFSQLIKNKESSTGRSILFQTGNSPSTICFHLLFNPLKNLWVEKRQKENLLRELRGSSGFNGTIDQAWKNKQIAIEKHHNAKEHIDKLTGGGYFQNWTFMQDLAQKNPHFSRINFERTTQEQGYTEAFSLYVNKEIVDAHNAYIISKDQLRFAEKNLEQLGYQYVLLMGNAFQVGQIEDLNTNIRELGREIATLFLKRIG